MSNTAEDSVITDMVGNIEFDEMTGWRIKPGITFSKTLIPPDSPTRSGGLPVTSMYEQFGQRLILDTHRVPPGTDIGSVILAGLNMLIFRYTGICQPVLALSISPAGRESNEFEIIPVETVLPPNIDIGTLVTSIALNIERSVSRAFFQNKNVANVFTEILVLLRDWQPRLTHELPGYNLMFLLKQEKVGTWLEVSYNADLYSEIFVSRMVDNLEKCIDSLLTLRDTCRSTLPILSDSEKHTQLTGFNQKVEEFPNKTFVDLFREQAARSPELCAIAFSDKRMTYRELDHQSSVLANRLYKKGIESGTVVALFIERSLEMIICMLGIMKAGCAYLPIDPEFPPDRINYILESAQVEVILASANLADIFSQLNDRARLLVLTDLTTSEEGSISELGITISIESLAYVIFTSASTGQPKGVMVRHRNVVNFIYALAAEIPFEQRRSLLMLAPFSFDLSISETLLPLARGVTVFIADSLQQRDPYHFNKIITNNKISMVHCTPSRLQAFISDSNCLEWIKTIEFLMIGGEALSDNLLGKVKALYHGKIYNLYGPTETTVWSTLKDLTYDNFLTIGRPLTNNYLYIMNEYSQLMPIGMAGEICIGGKNVSRGYLNNDILSSEKFVPDPFASYSGSTILYKTGDIGRWLNIGEVDYLGRKDTQVKIRGFRIELKEIEATILGHPEIDNAVVMLRELKGDHKVLCAYYSSKITIDVSRLRAALKMKLPEYMIPSFFIQLADFPTSHNGKLSLKDLPFESIVDENAVAQYDEIDLQVKELWEEVLGMEIKSIGTYFQEMGGHSLNAVILASRIRDIYKITIPASQIIISTVADVSWIIQSKMVEKAPMQI